MTTIPDDVASALRSPLMPDENFLIYGLRCTCHPDAGIRYVGQTTMRMERRLSSHRALARLAGARAYASQRWIQKHEYNIEIFPLERARNQQELDAAEIEWITSLRETHRLLNIRAGGAGGGYGYTHNPDAIEKIRQAKLGKKRGPLSDSHKAKISETHTGMKRSDETRAKISAALTGKKHPQARTDSRIAKVLAEGITRGERNGRAEFTRAQVIDVKRRLADRETAVSIADSLGCPTSRIYAIKQGKTWRDVA